MADIRKFFSPKGVKAGKAEKPEKSDKVDNAVKPAKAVKAEKPSKADNADNADKAVKPVKPAKAVKAEKPSKANTDVKPAKNTKAVANEAASLKPTRGAGVSSPVLKKHTPSPADSQKPTSSAPEKRGGRKRGRAVVEDDDYEVLPDEGLGEEEWVGDAHDEEEEEPAAKKGRKGKGRGKGAVMTVSAKIPQPAAKANASAGKGKGKGRGGGGGGGWGGFMQERAAPPHKGEKEVPRGPGDALAGVTIVISGVLDSLEREEAEDVIRSHGGRVTGSISGKTTYLLADEDIGGSKSKKAKDLSVPFLTEDALFALIRAKAAADPNWVPPPPPPPPSPPKRKPEGSPGGEPSSVRPKVEGGGVESEVWAAKHAPRSLDEVAANPALLNQLREWLKAWPHSGKGKKAVLLSGPPGIGKTSSARLACLEGGWVALEVNASDTRGKASSKVQEGVGGKLANCVKEMVRNRCVGGGGGAARPHHGRGGRHVGGGTAGGWRTSLPPSK